MKGILTAVTVASMLAMGPMAFAKVSTVPGPWMLNAPSGITFTCGGGSYPHTLNTVSQNADGSFTGTGSYNPDASYIWNITGSITDSNIAFTIVYTGSNAGYALNGVGTIGSDGSISGTVDGNCESFSTLAGAASQFAGNHGQYVSSQDDKQAAAQSRIGMPVQSQGHTK
jgi:hypothetical protein